MLTHTKRMDLIPLTINDLEDACVDVRLVLKKYGFSTERKDMSKELMDIYATKVEHMHRDPFHALFSTYFWMQDRMTKALIGEIGFKGLQDSFFSVEVGYGTEAAFRNQGYMTEALEFMVGWAFSQSIDGLLYVTATTDKENMASQQVLIKNGFTLFSDNEKDRQWMIDRKLFMHRLEEKR